MQHFSCGGWQAEAQLRAVPGLEGRRQGPVWAEHLEIKDGDGSTWKQLNKGSQGKPVAYTSHEGTGYGACKIPHSLNT